MSPVFGTRRRSRRPFFRSRNIATEWVPSLSSFQVTPAAPVFGLPLIPNEVVKTMTEPTFYGGYLDVTVMADRLEGTDSLGVVSLGIHVLPQRVTEASVPSWPLPFSDAEGDWPFLRNYLVVSNPADAGTTGGLPNFDLQVVREHHRLRSRRRVTEDDVVFLVAELLTGPPIVPAGQICLTVFARLLMRQK